MTQNKVYLLRKSSGDLTAESEQEIRDWFKRGQCKPADFLFDYSAGRWLRLGDLPGLADLFGQKPARPPEKKLIYYVSPGATPTALGPFSMAEIQQKMLARELCEGSWVFVEGDKEWRQVRGIKVLLDLLPALPQDQPAAPASREQTNPSIMLDMGGDGPPPMNPGDEVEREEATMAFSALGLSSLKTDHSAAPPGPPPISAPPVKPPPTPQPAPSEPARPVASHDPDEGSFDGITAEIPFDPVWLVKRADAETVSGPYAFLEVMKFLQDGRINKNDKISRVGTNRFVKIQQQYEFNVKYSVETVIERGVEKQKILIKRRHPRVPYFSEVQIISGQGSLTGRCVNVSAGGILIEAPKAEFKLGDIVEVKVMPGLITRAISCRCMIIGKIPKIPPGYALKFEDLKNEDKEAIEFYVQESLKREMSKKS